MQCREQYDHYNSTAAPNTNRPSMPERAIVRLPETTIALRPEAPPVGVAVAPVVVPVLPEVLEVVRPEPEPEPEPDPDEGKLA